MSLFNPHRLVNPYAAAFAAPPLPQSVKIETAGQAAYEYERQGILAENAQIVAINRGEMETSTSRGDFLRFSVPVVTASETYYVDQVVTETGNGGDTAFVPVIERGPEAVAGEELIYEPYATEQTPYIPYEDLSAYNYGQGEYVETAPSFDTFNGQSTYYTQPDNAVPYVEPPPPDDGGAPQVTQEQLDAEAAQQAIYEQAHQDYLQYIAGQQTEDYIDYYGGGEIV